VTVYLDHNATSALRPEALEAMTQTLAQTGNPSSVHAPGRAARARLETARETLARCICARTEDLVFTSGGTEALNLAVHAACEAGVRSLVVSAIEHAALHAAAKASGLPVEIWPVTQDGTADLDWLQARLQPGGEGVLFALMAANNETGVLQPVEAAGRMIREAGGLFLVDAVQAIGKTGFDFAASMAHFAVLSAHKAGGPMGAGALVAACDAHVSALIKGGGQEKGRRGGTENLPGAVGFAAAAEAALADADAPARMAAMRDHVQARLKEAAPDVRIWGGRTARLPNTLCLSAPGWPSELQVIALDLEGFAVSAGSACSSGKARKSQVLEAMGADAAHAAGALRVSFGWTSTMDEAEAFADAWLNTRARACPVAAVS